MRRGRTPVALGAWLAMSGVSFAQDVNPFEQSQDETLLVEEALLDEGDGSSIRIYGFIEAYLEKVAATPVGVDAAGQTVFEENPHEFDVANAHLMVQGVIASRFRYFLNLAAPGSGSPAGDVEAVVRNAWVEIPLAGDALMVRAGKTYRRFGLYNEILDAVPTFLGIEAPELFDQDHLLLTRTTNLMVHGQLAFDDSSVVYALMTGNDERASDEIPLGVDLYFDWAETLRIGTSFYTTGGDAAPTRETGSPVGAVLNWMEKDRYMVFGGYGQLRTGGFSLEAAYWQAQHEATRDPDKVIGLLEAGLNPRQLAHFGLDGDAPTAADVPVEVSYTVQAFYARMGYAFETDAGEIIPYVQLDFYRNPETIQSKRFGGDNEAGLSDDGQFIKPTVGIAYRPDPAVALKVDGSTHIQQFNEETVQYPEIRVSLSYFWQLDGSR